jgi:hypothetical protein
MLIRGVTRAWAIKEARTHFSKPVLSSAGAASSVARPIDM